MWSRLASCALSASLFSAAALAAERPSISVAYLGDFATHPGMMVGLDAVVAKRGGGHVDALVLAGNVGVYVHARNHTGVLADAEIGYRLTLRSGFVFEAFAGAGYLHTFLGAPAYVVVDGEPEKVPVVSRPAFMPVVGAGVGWQLETVAPFVRLESFGQYPFNHHLLPHLALVAGVRF